MSQESCVDLSKLWTPQPNGRRHCLLSQKFVVLVTSQELPSPLEPMLESVSSSLRQRSNLFCCISFQVSHLVQSVAFHQEHGSSDGRVLSLISVMSCTCWSVFVHQNHLQSCLVSWLEKSHFRFRSLIRSRVLLIRSQNA